MFLSINNKIFYSINNYLFRVGRIEYPMYPMRAYCSITY